MTEERRRQFDADLDTPVPAERRSSHAALAVAAGGDVVASRRS